MAPKDIVLAFDVYGTLLSTESIAKKLASHFGEEMANTLSMKWRLYQLEYTWRANSMNRYETFSSITQKSLKHVLAEQGLSLSESDTKDLMSAYDSLDTFPDVIPALEAISKEQNLTSVLFTNGTHASVSTSVHSSASLSPHAGVFKDLITVDDLKIFKPAPETYYHVADKTGRGRSGEDMASIWLISGNPFDNVGARAVGCNTAWVNRTGKPWVDALGDPDLRPTVEVSDIGEVVGKIKDFIGNES